MVQSLGEAVVHVGADTSTFKSDVTKGVADASRSVQQLGKDMQGVGKKLSLSLTAPLGGIAALAIKTQAQYEQTMNVMAVNTGATAQEMAKLDGLAKQLGADTVFSAGEAAGAMLELAKGGFKPAQIAGGGVQAVMALAATEGIELAEAATIAGNAMNTFGLEAKNASQIADALAGGSMSSSASVQSLAQALQQVGPGARNAGLDLQDTVGVLASFASAGIQGSDAGTSLKTMLTRLVPQTKKAKDEMRELGLSFVDSKGNIDDITTVAEKLRTKLSGLSQEQRTTALATIFGSDATRAATVLMNEGEKGIRGYIKATKEQGTAQKLAEARMSGTAGAIEKMKGSIENAALALGEALAPAVIKVAGFVGDLTDKFSDLSPEMQTTVAVVGAAVAAAGPLLFIGGSLIRTVATLGGTFTAASAKLSLFSTNMQTATGRATVMQSTMTKLGGVAKFAAGAGGIAAITASTQESSRALGTLEKAAGGALLGFSVGGPIGAAVGAGAGTLWSLADAFLGTGDASETAKTKMYDFKDSLNQTTGAVTGLTKELLRQSLIEDGAADAARTLGISMRDVIGFAAGNEAAIRRVNRQMEILSKPMKGDLVGNEFTARQSSVNALSEALGLNIGALRRNRAEVRQAARDTASWTETLKGIPKAAVTELRQTGFKPSVENLKALQAEYKLTPKQLNMIIRETGANAVIKNVGGVQKVLRDTGKQRADTKPWADSILNTLVHVSGQTKTKGREIAEGMTGPIKNARANASQFTGSLDKELNIAERIARAGGLEIGGAMKSGVVSGFSGTSNALALMAAQSVTAAINAAKRAGDIQSPSKKMAQVGKWLGEGLAGGMDSTNSLVASAGGRMAHAAMSGAASNIGAVPRPAMSMRTLSPAHTYASRTPAPPASVTTLAPSTSTSEVNINQNYYGPNTSRDRLRELEWTMRYATGRDPVQTIATG